MNLLERIAHSHGDLQRTILALRLINQHLEHELDWYSAHPNSKVCPTSLLARLGQTKSEYGHIALSEKRNRSSRGKMRED